MCLTDMLVTCIELKSNHEKDFVKSVNQVIRLFLHGGNMMMFFRTVFFMAAIFAIVGVRFAPAGSVSDGVPVFTDGFTTEALMAEMWNFSASDDWSIANGNLNVVAGRNTAAAPHDLRIAGSLAVSFRLQVRDFAEDGSVGARVRGVRFLLTVEGFKYEYVVDGRQTLQGKTSSVKAPVAGRWYDVRIEQYDDIFRWFIDGESAGEFSEPEAIQGAGTHFQFISSGAAASFDNIVVAPISTDKELSRNFLRNAAFEDVPDFVPNYWKPHGNLMIPVPPERLWENWGVTTDEAWYGRQSLRFSDSGIQSHQNGMPVGTPCTFSIYLKADRPGLRSRS